ncbi:MAG: nitroreductase family protein [Rhodothermales bacterium]|nr:nitroreductase family protein [Rhodothermales bacterium]
MNTVLEQVDVESHRKPDADIEPVLYERWSPRAMDGSALSNAELDRLFEAARWAPSSYNRQPWRFVYALQDTDHWSRFLDLLVEFNRKWASDAGALIVILSKKITDEGEPARTHAFDTGAAWQNLTLQANSMGLVAHGMEGFDYDKAREILNVPDDHEIHAMVAVGRPGERDELPPELAKREQPSGRRPVNELAFQGKFSQR